MPVVELPGCFVLRCEGTSSSWQEGRKSSVVGRGRRSLVVGRWSRSWSWLFSWSLAVGRGRWSVLKMLMLNKLQFEIVPLDKQYIGRQYVNDNRQHSIPTYIGGRCQYYMQC